MENANRQEMNVSKRMSVLVIGILMCIASVILFAIGYATTARGGLWIAAVVIGMIAAGMLVYSAYTSSGMYRAMAMFFLAAQIVFITIMATMYFGGIATAEQIGRRA